MPLLRLLLPFFLFLSATPLLAQFQLIGTVTNPLHTPIPFASVALGAGAFRITNLSAGQASLTVTAIGYQPYKVGIDLRQDTLIFIVLQPLSTQLNEVVVTGSKLAVVASATGLTTQQHIHEKLIEKAKEKLPTSWALSIRNPSVNCSRQRRV